MYSYGLPHMAEQNQNDQLEHTYSSYVRIRDVALKTCQSRWTIGRSGGRGSGISVLAARHDDNDDDDTHETLVPFGVNSSSCNALVVPFQQLLEGQMEVLLCQHVNDLRHILFLLHIVLIKCSHVQIALLKFTSCDNQALFGCIPIPAVAVHLKLKSWKLVSHLIRCIAITYWIFKSLRQFKMPVKKSLETYRMHLICEDKQSDKRCRKVNIDYNKIFRNESNFGIR